MNNELTDIYRIINYYYPEIIEKYSLKNNKEFLSFLHYNMYNEIYMNINKNEGIIFRNLDDCKTSEFTIQQDGIYFLPSGAKIISYSNDIVAFKVNNNIKSLIVNDNGLFIETVKLGNMINTDFYDNAALKEISKEDLRIKDIDNIENYIRMMGIMPDNYISTYMNDDTLEIDLVENYEIVNKQLFEKGIDRTMYSLYYEFMKFQGYYKKNKKTLGLRK